MTQNAIYDKLYSQTVTDQQLEHINSEICPLFIGGNWFHNLIKKKYHKQYKTKRDAFNSYYRTVIEFKADKYLLDSISGQWMVRFAITGESFAYNQIRKMVSSVVETAGLGGNIDFLKG